ncbi:uncharacterized protein LOC142634181 [Castanea sativa]|uniref:uncharacterized protein LOC142634181 n=1 Tax=Castanea sativa TaxID=21020 RepID=UPI003F653A04
MTEEKKTTYMRIKVDLQCPRCRKKIKKVLCKFPQIRDQVYNEKENYVVIKVVCCCPEKVKQKIIRKGGDTIQCIEIIKEPEKKPEPQKKPEKKPEPEKKKPPPASAENPPPVEPPVAVEPVPKPPVPKPPVRRRTCCTECSEGRVGGPCLYDYCTRPWPHVPLPVPVPVPAYPGVFRTCCTECSEGRDGGPCHYGPGRPTPCYGRPIYDSYGGGYGSCYTYVGRCEETSSGCTIM